MLRKCQSAAAKAAGNYNPAARDGKCLPPAARSCRARCPLVCAALCHKQVDRHLSKEISGGAMTGHPFSPRQNMCQSHGRTLNFAVHCRISTAPTLNGGIVAIATTTTLTVRNHCCLKDRWRTVARCEHEAIANRDKNDAK